MNVLRQIDECFDKYLDIYGRNEIDSNWDDGIVVNKYIKLGNEENVSEQKEQQNVGKSDVKCDIKSVEENAEKSVENNLEETEKPTNKTTTEEDFINKKLGENTNEKPTNEKNQHLSKEVKQVVKKKKNNLFVFNDIVENCVCLNNIDTLENVNDEVLVRWTCMVQQIIAPESYLGIYKLKNKINGNEVLRSSKYRDYIDVDENHELVMEEVQNPLDEGGLEFNFKKYYGEQEEEREKKKEQAMKELDKGKKQKDKMQRKALKEAKKEAASKEQNAVEKKQTDRISSSRNIFDPMSEPQSDVSFKKYWRRYLFFCTNIPGCKSQWCKELSEYSSSHSNIGEFLKRKSDFEKKMYTEHTNQNNVEVVEDVESRMDSSSSEKEEERKKYEDNCLEGTEEEKNKKVKGSHKKEKKGKLKCVIKIYDDNCQYNGKNENSFIKLNDVIEIIGIYRKHQIRDYDDYKKNFNFYFYYDQNFLKYSCIHVFQYNKINYFNPIMNCVFFKNELSDILESGPYTNVADLRKHLLIFISKAFCNDLLVAYYFFFYLTGNYIKESKMKLGKVSLNICNVFYEEEEEQKQMEEYETKREQSEIKKLLDLTKVKSEFEKSVKARVSYEDNVKEEQALKEEVKGKQKEADKGKTEKKDEQQATEKQVTEKQVTEKQATEKQGMENTLQKKTVEKTTQEDESTNEGKKKEKRKDVKHAKRINRMIKALVPVYRYIPLLLKQLSKKYLVSVMNHETDKLKKGKLQVVNNTYLTFDECILDVGKLNHVSLKNFQCIERLIVSQEIPFIFNTDITFDTQTNILVISKKQSMYRNYVDITVPILYPNKAQLFEKIRKRVEMQIIKDKKEQSVLLNKATTQTGEIQMEREMYKGTEVKTELEKVDEHNKEKKESHLDYSIFSKEFVNTDEKYQPTKKEFMQFRRYINHLLSKNHAAKIDQDVTNYITESFVTLRQKHKEINQFVLNSWVCMARILAFSEGNVDIKKSHWDFIMKLENERRLRIQNINKIYI